MRRYAVAICLMLAFLGTSASAEPSAHPTECSEFSTQAEAQTYFDAQGEDYLNLDSDSNGIACDQPGDYGQTGPSAHPSECGDFTSQADAQTYFDIQGEDYLNLDTDGNEIACDEAGASDLPETGSEETTDDTNVVGLPTTGSGPANGAEVIAQLLLVAASVLLAGFGLATRSTKD